MNNSRVKNLGLISLEPRDSYVSWILPFSSLFICILNFNNSWLRACWSIAFGWFKKLYEFSPVGRNLWFGFSSKLDGSRILHPRINHLQSIHPKTMRKKLTPRWRTPTDDSHLDFSPNRLIHPWINLPQDDSSPDTSLLLQCVVLKKWLVWRMRNSAPLVLLSSAPSWKINIFLCSWF